MAGFANFPDVILPFGTLTLCKCVWSGNGTILKLSWARDCLFRSWQSDCELSLSCNVNCIIVRKLSNVMAIRCFVKNCNGNTNISLQPNTSSYRFQCNRSKQSGDSERGIRFWFDFVFCHLVNFVQTVREEMKKVRGRGYSFTSTFQSLYRPSSKTS